MLFLVQVAFVSLFCENPIFVSMYCSMVAAFGSGALFSIVSGMGGPNQAANAVTSGLFFALVQGGLFKVRLPHDMIHQFGSSWKVKCFHFLVLSYMIALRFWETLVKQTCHLKCNEGAENLELTFFFLFSKIPNVYEGLCGCMLFQFHSSNTPRPVWVSTACMHVCLYLGSQSLVRAESTFHMAMQLGQKFSQPPTEDIYYAKTRSMLNNLGLQSYEKNFKKGLLSDNTLPLLNDRQVAGLAYSFITHITIV